MVGEALQLWGNSNCQNGPLVSAEWKHSRHGKKDLGKLPLRSKLADCRLWETMGSSLIATINIMC